MFLTRPLRAAALAGGAVAAVLALNSPAAAQPHVHEPATPPPAERSRPAPAASREQFQIQAVRSGAAIEIDGLLNDEAWRNAPMIDSFTQQEPVDGQPATER